MNLYLVLALALGVTAPVVSPREHSVAAECKLTSQQIAVQFAVRSSQIAVKQTHCERRSANCELSDAPLTGASTPRAPASGC